MSLMKPLINKGYCLTIDNFYSSVELFKLLSVFKRDAYGTVRSNRKGLPINIKNPKEVNPEYVRSFRKERLMAMRWKDKRNVYFLSTIHGADQVEIEKRGIIKMKPKVSVDYNFTMGGVDRVDQHLSSYPLPRKRGKK
ncbi:piggyBac transposable element-derived protein 4-like [Ctenocephalides felis]|nr:piggyBac transposable element-derived protein 4-like [Ctenocephalides felis]